MVIGATGDVRLRETCDDLIEQKSGGHIGIRSSARKPLVHAAIGLASVAMAGGAAAQEALPTIDVSGQGQGGQAEDTGYRATSTGVSRIPTPLRDTPQTINVVTQEVIRDQGARTMEDALRNVPGITFSAGEGGQQGDAPLIRGFSARTDIFRDGIRDPGWYTRDVFATESLEVFKGPSAFAFGRGSTGGAINLTSKQATGATFFEGTLTGSTPKGVRSEIDASGQINPNIDARIAALWQDVDTPDRDNIWTKRWGVAPSLNVRLNEQARVKLGYIYQGEEGVPDYGHPYLPQPARSNVTGNLTNPGYYGNGQPVGPVPVNRSNFYGVTGGPLADRTTTETHILTGRFEYDITNQLKFANTTRYFAVDRSSRPTAPRSILPNAAGTPIDNMTIGRQHFWTETNNNLLVNQSEITGKIDTGPLQHTVVVGTEYDKENRWQHRAIGMGNSSNLCNPALPECRTDLSNPQQTGFGGEFLGWNKPQTTVADTYAVYASDSIKLNQYWDILGAIRYDMFKTSYTDLTQTNPANRFSQRTDNMLSYRFGAVFHPTTNSSIYGAYGVSYNPSAEAGTLSSNPNATNGVLLAPEKNTVWEVGAKVDVLDNRVTLSAAYFNIEKTNLRIPTDPNDSTLPLILDGLAVSKGVEFGLVGRITEKWQMTAGYSYNETEIVKTTNLAELGRRLSGTPLNSFTLWTTYDITPQWTVGGGALWQSEAFANLANTAFVPDFWKFDAMMAYKVDKNWTLQLNVYNLTNELYYSQYYGGHAVPAAGRYASLSVRARW